MLLIVVVALNKLVLIPKLLIVVQLVMVFVLLCLNQPMEVVEIFLNLKLWNGMCVIVFLQLFLVYPPLVLVIILYLLVRGGNGSGPHRSSNL